MKFLKKTANSLTGNTTRYIGPVYKMIGTIYSHVLGQSGGQALTEEQMHERYLEVFSKFDDADSKLRWKNYVTTVIIIWCVALISSLWSLLAMSFITLIQSLLLVAFVWICLGYRIWVIKEKKYPPFFQYLKLVPKSLMSALPFNALNLVE